MERHIFGTSIMNKKRWRVKQNGLSNKDYCQHCLSYYCDPMYHLDTIANKKRLARRRAGLCEACGKVKKQCHCKSKEINK